MTLPPRQPLAHRVAWWLGRRGVRGASWYWRLAERAAARPAAGVVLLPDRTPLAFDSADWTSLNAYRGLYERTEIRLIRSLLQPGDVAVDIGANIGVMTVVMAGAVGVKGRVLALEPSPLCWNSLEAAVGALGTPGVVEIMRVAAGAADGSATLARHDHPRHRGLGSLRFGDAADGVHVAVRSLHELLDAAGVTRIALLKMDVEGCEPALLASLDPRLDDGTIDALLVEVSPEFGTSEAVADVVNRHCARYDAFAVDEVGRLVRRMALHRVTEAEVRARSKQFNLLFRRRG